MSQLMVLLVQRNDQRKEADLKGGEERAGAWADSRIVECPPGTKIAMRVFSVNLFTMQSSFQSHLIQRDLSKSKKKV